jgi:hypothetical protein
VRILPEPVSISTICEVTVVTDWKPVQLPVLGGARSLAFPRVLGEVRSLLSCPF